MSKTIAYIQIAFGCLISAATVNLFMVPNHLPSGGMSGLILVLHYLWSLPIGPTYFLANIPGVLLLLKVFGWNGLMKTAWGIGALSLFLDLTRPLTAHAPTENLLLATIYSGVLMGTGIGLTLKAGGSIGGTTSFARVVHHYTSMSMSKFLLVTDLVILALGALTLSIEAIMYGLIMTFIIARVVQVVQEGLSTSRCLLIISEQPDAVSAAIMEAIKRGITRLDGTGEYTRQPRPVLMCVVSETEVPKLKRLVLSTDPEAFVLVTDAREVSGRGFTVDTEIRRIPFWAAQGGD